MKRPNPYIDLPLTAGKVVYTLIASVIYLAQLVCGSLCGFFWFTLGKKDDLTGFEENVIMGNLIPAGTGLNAYRKLKVSALGDGGLNEGAPAEGSEVVDSVGADAPAV